MSDDELRSLFAQEATTRLDRLANQLLELESSDDPELLASVFRDAHTLKGSAALVELPGIARVAHAMEDVLDDVRAGRRPVTTPLVDGLLLGVDGLRRAVPDLL